MHDHVQKSFPGENFCPPVFWCEDCDTVEGSILLHYFSQRGNLLVPWVVGIVEELASFHFEVDVKMNRIAKQDEDGSKFTTWRVTAVDESQMWKLSPKTVHADVDDDEVVDFSAVKMPSKCPFTGKKLRKEMDSTENMCPHAKREMERMKTETTASVSTASSSSSLSPDSEENKSGLSMRKMKEVFPFHVMVDKDFKIAQVGEKLPKLLKTRSHDLAGVHIRDVLKITRPVLGTSWDWLSLNKLSDQNFFLAPAKEDADEVTRASQHVTADGQQKFGMGGGAVKFKASIVHLTEDRVMFTLSPEARNVEDLNNMGLTLSDLPLQSCQRDAVFLGEYITQEADKAHGLDKLSRTLGAEQALSNTLLYNILPKQVADDMRKGKTIEPKFHENVTLFFSDIVGFTEICGQVEPWNVIDMMNQLYSVMDFLADRFNLYKVETVGDSYMCCSGLPEPDEYHAENVANFALAVLECVKHVKSPVTGEPINLRIGIHTGSCTSGVVGTLTPHYCLFGDMVNFTSRHESTGVPGKIHASSVLYGRLTHFAKSDNRDYNFKARGLVDMKGKGEHYTYWLESGTEHNDSANPTAVQTLSEEVEEMISSRKWKMRKYFRNGGLFRGESAAANGSSSNEESSGYHSHSDSSRSGRFSRESGSVHSDDGDIADDIEDDEIHAESIDTSVRIVELAEEQLESFGVGWEELHCGERSNTSLPRKIFEILSNVLQVCVGKGGARLKMMAGQLEKYIQTIADLYSDENLFHSFELAAEVVLRANYIWDNWASEVSKDPWDHFMLLFAALIHGAQHTGVDNSQLEAENDVIFAMYRGKQAYQQRSSFDCAFETLEEDFEELHEEIVFGCPNFRACVKKLVVNFTDLESEEMLRSMVGNFEKIMAKPSDNERVLKEQREAKVGLVLAMSTVGHYAQSYDMFLKWNNLNFQEHLKAHRSGRSEDPRDSWYYEQNMFFSDAVMPLVNQMERVLPKATCLGDCVLRNIEQWRRNGRDRLAASLVPTATVENDRGEKLSLDRMGALIAANVDVLEGLLKDLVASHAENRTRVRANDHRRMNLPVDEIQMSIEMKSKTTEDFRPTSDLPPHVRAELRDFVITVASGYESNNFHNFQHASHVAHLANLLVNGINGIDGSMDGSGIACDPLARFAIVLSALVHDVGHTGVPNNQLAVEHPELAEKYSNKSIAEQNSIDVAWDMLNSDSFEHLQHYIFEDAEERERLRKLLVNCVMATDIFDKDLRSIRQTRWDKVYSDSEKLHSDEEEQHLKATIIIEHIMQAADVAHTMQDWELYRQWNESLFLEFHQAFLDVRSDKDPSDNWYNGELWFFENWVVPLATNLKTCGVLDIVSDQLVEQAKSNRRQWEAEGKEICAAMVKSAKAKANSRTISDTRSISSMRSSESEIMLTSKIVNEVESLSKVVKRYERKMEAACGNLIAVAYKGRPDGKDLRKKNWSDIHHHFKQQEWYKLHSDDELSVDGSVLSGTKGGQLSSYLGGRKNSDDLSSIGSVSGLRSQLMLAEKVIASSKAA
mmetsp:Transcript_22486/g.55637  ORF Transcript_22486/g.55637 Transcript_22486/m.55637 type:complete len:1526 (-) Transcript_22486:168-4745(-)|eukprot:CAMPEP_0113632808 /NCGR_PEP_ID=MMETSP0017_2-20120614/17061_1 /TAXON_ID=2856 /ORGANISM="Cylindrotheca closterium" /LENGTH=1525 /DNA_ID=CAMNT_0000543395 /DNA_START=261 /DNA_END=4838 /DNA_ORIENTATION=+ /assembly_acc=CAM_ASM_000147